MPQVAVYTSLYQEMKMNGLTELQIIGVKRPARGPYPPGVDNGPLPTTARGIRRRKERTKDAKPRKEDETS